jgi:hypothetical protein
MNGVSVAGRGIPKFGMEADSARPMLQEEAAVEHTAAERFIGHDEPALLTQQQATPARRTVVAIAGNSNASSRAAAMMRIHGS